MPEPIIRTASSAARAVPRQRGRSRPPLVRQLREQDWRTLVGTYRLLSRMVVERTKHHLIDDADSFTRDAALVEEELEHLFPFRWPRRRSERRRCVVGSTDVLNPCRARGQIAWASSVNTAATRRMGGASTASS
jgi:hypothetical protein